MYHIESILTDEISLLSHNFLVNNDYKSHYLLVNYDRETLFMGVKILQERVTILAFI